MIQLCTTFSGFYLGIQEINFVCSRQLPNHKILTKTVLKQNLYTFILYQ